MNWPKLSMGAKKERLSRKQADLRDCLVMYEFKTSEVANQRLKTASKSKIMV